MSKVKCCTCNKPLNIEIECDDCDATTEMRALIAASKSDNAFVSMLAKRELHEMTKPSYFKQFMDGPVKSSKTRVRFEVWKP